MCANHGTEAAPKIDAGLDLRFQPVCQELKFGPEIVARGYFQPLPIHIFTGNEDECRDGDRRDTDQDVLDLARGWHVGGPGLGKTDTSLGQGGMMLSTSATAAMQQGWRPQLVT